MALVAILIHFDTNCSQLTTAYSKRPTPTSGQEILSDLLAFNLLNNTGLITHNKKNCLSLETQYLMKHIWKKYIKLNTRVKNKKKLLGLGKVVRLVVKNTKLSRCVSSE